MDERVDPFYEYYYETGEDITGEILEQVQDDEEELEDEESDDAFRVTPEHISTLEPDEIFVFGSNREGQHWGGAARFAYDHFGAEWGVGEGINGQCYALPTMDGDLRKLRKAVNNFIDVAEFNNHIRFLVTPVACGIAGRKPEEVAPLFRRAVGLPNVFLPQSFWNVLWGVKNS